MAWDDDGWPKFGKPLATRFGDTEGKSTERVMLSVLGDNWNPRRRTKRTADGGTIELVNGGGFSRFVRIEDDAASEQEVRVFKPLLSGIKFFAKAAAMLVSAFYDKPTIAEASSKRLGEVHFSCDGVLAAHMPDKDALETNDSMVPATHAPFVEIGGELKLIFGEAVDGEKNVVLMPAKEVSDGDAGSKAIFGTNLHGKLWLESHVLTGAGVVHIAGGPRALHPYVDTAGVSFSGLPAADIGGDLPGREFLSSAILYGSRKFYGVGDHAMELGYNASVVWAGGRCFYTRTAISEASNPAMPEEGRIAGSGVIRVQVQYLEVVPHLVVGASPSGGDEYLGRLGDYEVGYEFYITPSVSPYVATAIAHFAASGMEVDVVVNIESAIDAEDEDYSIQGYEQKFDYDIRLGVQVGDGLSFSPLPLTPVPSNTSQPIEGVPLVLGQNYGYTYSTLYIGPYWWDGGFQAVYQESVEKVLTGGETSLVPLNGSHVEQYGQAPTFYGQDRKFIKITERKEYSWSASISDPDGSSSWTYDCFMAYLVDSNIWTFYPPNRVEPGGDFDVVTPPSVITKSGSRSHTYSIEQAIEYDGISLATSRLEEVTTWSESKTFACADFASAHLDGVAGHIWGALGGQGAMLALSGGPWMPGGTPVATISGTSLMYQGSKRISSNLIQIAWTVVTHSGGETSSQNQYALVCPNGLLTIRDAEFAQGRVSWNPITGEWFEIVGDESQNYDTWC